MDKWLESMGLFVGWFDRNIIRNMVCLVWDIRHVRQETEPAHRGPRRKDIQ